ncbi:MAG: ABC transporter substrate-binding protein [Acidimicrobiales bacterium]|nr:ABC transporter substrate-binding protein [Acidimicrobiales bacterium]
MPRPKRLLLVILGVLLPLTLVAAACSGDDDDGGGSSGTETTEGGGGDSALPECPVDALESASGPVSIDFWWGVPGGEVSTTIQALVDRYNAAQDTVQVNLVLNNSYDENLDKYRAASPGDRPEIIQLEDTATQLMIDSQTTLPVQSCIEASGYDTSDYLPRLLAYYTVEDVMWPMVYNVSNPILYYNKLVFERAGLDPDVAPTTFDELRQMSQQIVDSGAASYGLSFGITPWEWVEQQFAISGELYVNEENGRAARATEALFDNELGVGVVQWLNDMVDDGLAINVGLNVNGQDNLLKLVDQQEPSAMTINTTAALATVFSVAESTYPDTVKVGIAPLPAYGTVDGGVMVGGGALWMVADKSAEEIAASWDFIQWLNDPVNHADFSVGTGYIPIRESEIEEPVIQEAWGARPEFRVAYDQLVEGALNPGSAGPVIGPYRQIRDAMQQNLERVFAGQMTPEEMMAATKAQADTDLADYARRTGTGG